MCVIIASCKLYIIQHIPRKRHLYLISFTHTMLISKSVFVHFHPPWTKSQLFAKSSNYFPVWGVCYSSCFQQPPVAYFPLWHTALAWHWIDYFESDDQWWILAGECFVLVAESTWCVYLFVRSLIGVWCDVAFQVPGVQRGSWGV